MLRSCVEVDKSERGMTWNCETQRRNVINIHQFHKKYYQV